MISGTRRLDHGYHISWDAWQSSCEGGAAGIFEVSIEITKVVPAFFEGLRRDNSSGVCIFQARPAMPGAQRVLG